MMNLKIVQEENMALKEAISQEGQRKEITQKKVDQIVTQIDVFFQSISYDTVYDETSLEEKIMKISQTLQQYKDQIKEMEEGVVPMNPPTVRVQREKELKTTTKNIV